MPTEKECREIIDKAAKEVKEMVERRDPMFKDKILDTIDKNKDKVADKVCKDYGKKSAVGGEPTYEEVLEVITTYREQIADLVIAE